MPLQHGLRTLDAMRSEPKEHGCGAVEVFLDDLLERQAAALRRHTSLSIHTEFQPTYVVGDESALTHMVHDLVDGAAQRADSSLDISVHRRLGAAVIVVGDDGELCQRDTGRIDVDRIAETVTRHGGTIAVDDRRGVGTFVTVTLQSTRRR